MKVLITRPRAQADDFAEKLRSAGFEPIFFPVIEIQPIENNVALERALERLNCYEWMVFTSVNAVDVVFNEYSAFFLKENKGVKFAAIGPKTAEALRKHNIEPGFVPEEYVAEAILPGLGNVKGKWILLPRAEIARQELPKAISKAGGIAHEVTVYKTLSAKLDLEGLDTLKSGMDAVAFTSASTVENFVAILRQNKIDPLSLPNNPLFVCIGPITAHVAREEGFQNIVVAKEYTTDGVMQEIISAHESQQEKRS
ncbi:MAG: uroporphyrinogen-III synthase [Chloroflexi bacterium]|nr:uroporphyrinogen-III synthase [Chloroflexota bacterium]